MGPRLTLLDTSRTTGADYVDTPIGVAAVLRKVAATRARAALYLDDGETFLYTCVLGVEPDAFYFEKGPDPKLNGEVLAAREMTLVTADHSVPVQFTVAAAEAATFEGADAFRAMLPERLLRLQRRDFYRLTGPELNSVMRVQVVPAHEPANLLQPVVIDLSCGGMSIDIPIASGSLPDRSRHTCTLEFPGLARIDTVLYVCLSREVSMENGVPGRRYGVEFLNLDAKSVALIQRFINDEERRLIRSTKK
jgi:c-di-GMP-binding flagellar brake protein YcgR